MMYMNYLDAYIQLISDNMSTIKVKYKTASHHIIPRSWMENIFDNYQVNLSHQDHFEAHRLLAKSFPENQEMVYAYWRMCNSKHGEKVSKEEYAEAKEMMAIATSKRTKGHKRGPNSVPAWNKGLSPSNKTKDKQSVSAKNRTDDRSMSDITKKKISISHTGKQKSKEAIEKSSYAKSDKTVYNWIHSDHGEVSMTRRGMVKNYNVKSGNLGGLISGVRKSVNGWKLNKE